MMSAKVKCTTSRLVLLALLSTCCAANAYAVDARSAADAIRDALVSASRITPRDPAARRQQAALYAVYARHDFSPMWIDNGTLASQALVLMQTLGTADQYGLRQQDYATGLDASRLMGLKRGSAPREPLTAEANLDMALSAAALRFLSDLHFGRVDPQVAGFNLQTARAPLDLSALLERLATTNSVDAAVSSVEPQFYHYQLLKQALLHYRLLASGQATATQAEIATAPFARRIRQIELTLERWRWLPAFTSPPIIVNIPQFRLFAFNSTQDRKSEILQMDVIVGRTYPNLRTPVFAAQMKFVTFRPYWDVPSSIVQREMLPALRANPDYLRHEHLEIVRGASDSAAALPPTPENISALAAGSLRLRQQPGADNALGLIKFMLPNAYNVYLHSTPAPRLFSQSRRAFSHGCIRVSDPVGLAAYVLRNAPGTWTREAILAAMDGSVTRQVNLATPIPVMILYGTALATEDGAVLFFDDIYGHDRKLEKLLNLPAVANR
jgi:murein L,D-transpeptidase YcbB/YkuD